MGVAKIEGTNARQRQRMFWCVTKISGLFVSLMKEEYYV
jgi:hypothetical protein